MPQTPFFGGLASFCAPRFFPVSLLSLYVYRQRSTRSISQLANEVLQHRIFVTLSRFERLVTESVRILVYRLLHLQRGASSSTLHGIASLEVGKCNAEGRHFACQLVKIKVKKKTYLSATVRTVLYLGTRTYSYGTSVQYRS